MLLELASIPNLETILKLRLFKLDFKDTITSICEPYSYLKQGIEDVKSSETLILIISLVLNVGNTLNNSNIGCFKIDTLSKLASTKDNTNKKSLLYFILKTAMDSKQVIENLPEKFKMWSLISRVNFKETEETLQHMEIECKNALGYLNLTDSLDEDTKKIVEQFFVGSVREILAAKKVIKIVDMFYSDFLNWLGKLIINQT